MQFHILGALEVTCGSGDLTPTAPKIRQVLALLLLRHNHIVQTRVLIEELWAENPPQSALATLQTYIYKLRKILAEDQLGEMLRTKAYGYVIVVPPDDLDYRRFERLLAEGQEAFDAGELEKAAALLSEGLSLWRGPALADVEAGEILTAEITRLEERRLRALELRIETDLRLGRHRELISELKTLISAHPLHEAFHGKLMLALHRSGRRYEALQAYQDLRKTLIRELGLEPSAEMAELHQMLLSSDSPPAPEVQVRAVGAAPPAGPARPRRLPPAQLPPDIADFTGREEILRRLERALLPGGDRGTAPRVVSIAGMPGSGKTALGVRLAHRVRAGFPGGQLYADLRGLSNNPVHPSDVLAQFLGAAGIAPEEIPATLSERSKLFRTWTASNQVLIVLDDARSAAQVLPLLPGSAECSVIVTGRFHIPVGAESVTLGMLKPDEGLELLTRTLGKFRVSMERQAAERIVAMCGGLPLALRAAGARLAATHGWPLSKLADQLANSRTRLSMLRVGDLDVRASHDSSYQRLGESEKSAFRVLSLLPAGEFTAAKAATLLTCDADTAETMLGRLVESHLLLVTRHDGSGLVHYTYPELTRFYARERLDALLSEVPRVTEVPAPRPGVVYQAAQTQMAAKKSLIRTPGLDYGEVQGRIA
ncbi:AfsR/SARP family transcriptional regulator [Rhizohabitans arisaemae]|uniref:AfsR/SARP family transcriptional regulator n=1 Tax=Rhizohabitans arisaemae TaxID=2720610 RepID=UPI0024B278D2|nr:AfsR/SARP family transcriptional regulator [Rhizohabitans arisaemae]